MNIVEEYQNILYNLFRTKILNNTGIPFVHKNGVSEEVIPKSEIAEKLIEILNEFGSEMASDGRLK